MFKHIKPLSAIHQPNTSTMAIIPSWGHPLHRTEAFAPQLHRQQCTAAATAQVGRAAAALQGERPAGGGHPGMQQDIVESG